MSLRERPLPSIFQNTGFGNGKICWTTPDTPGLTLDPHSPPPPRENILDQRMIMHQSFLSMPPPPPTKKNLRRWLGMVGPRCRPIRVCLSLQCRGFNTGTVIFVILFFLLCTNLGWDKSRVVTISLSPQGGAYTRL